MRPSIFLVASCLALAGPTPMPTGPGGPADAPSQDQAEWSGPARPFLALWQESAGRRPGSRAPYLRFAIWADGRVVYAKDPGKWGHELLRGRISPARVARLRTALAESGIFDLQGNCYLVPDAEHDCLMVDLGGKQQMLHWDEVQTPNYGINIDPKPHHREFQRCWKAVNQLALVALPDEGKAVPERFRVPESWNLRPAIQSE